MNPNTKSMLEAKALYVTFESGPDELGRRTFMLDWWDGSRWRGQVFRAHPHGYLYSALQRGVEVLEVLPSEARKKGVPTPDKLKTRLWADEQILKDYGVTDHAFGAWLTRVNAFCRARLQVGLLDLPDMMTRDAYDAGVEPKEFFDETVMDTAREEFGAFVDEIDE